jgi:hypothetical protein
MQPPTLWYENDAGDRWIPPDDMNVGPPVGFNYQHSRFPFSLRHLVLVCDDKGSRQLAAGEQGANADLVIALCRPSALERARQLLRYGRLRRSLEPRAAFLTAAIACEGCMNSLAHEHGLPWGYRRGSKGWEASRTSCELCGTVWPPLPFLSRITKT